MKSSKVQILSSFAWSIAEILRGDFKQSEYGKIILPFVVLRRLDCILEPTKEAVIRTLKILPVESDDHTKDMIMFNAVGNNLKVYNYSNLTLSKIKEQEPLDVHKNLMDYITKFNSSVRNIFLERFLFAEQLKRLNEGGVLWQIFDKFVQIDLHPNKISNLEMGYLFEDLIRRFSEISNETAGEHFTPREVIKLMVDLLLINDADAIVGSGIIRTVYDPACGTGGMLALMEEAMKEFNPKIHIELYGQELNPESFGICKSDMLVTSHNPEQIAYGNTLTEDAHKNKKFHYILSNPPYGVDWKKYQNKIVEEAKIKGLNGRFGAGLPRISDGQLLFLQHMIAKMRSDDIGSRIGIVMNGSPLFTGGAGSGESEIRRWVIENDWLEAIIALPTDLFYNTGIQTYIWILTNSKEAKRRGKVQLINASSKKFWKLMRKSFGNKRREIPKSARDEIVRIYHNQDEVEDELREFSKTLDASEFGYREIKIGRPLRLNFILNKERLEKLKIEKPFLKLGKLEQKRIIELFQKNLLDKLFLNRNKFEKILIKIFKKTNIKISISLKKSILRAFSQKDEKADACKDSKGNIESDSDLRDTEIIPLKEDCEIYFKREVVPFVPDAFIDKNHKDKKDKKIGRIGYEINFNRYFYKYISPRPASEIDKELKKLEVEIADLLKESALL